MQRAPALHSFPKAAWLFARQARKTLHHRQMGWGCCLLAQRRNLPGSVRRFDSYPPPSPPTLMWPLLGVFLLPHPAASLHPRAPWTQSRTNLDGLPVISYGGEPCRCSLASQMHHEFPVPVAADLSTVFLHTPG